MKKALGKYGPADVEDATDGDSKDDDDIDLFGSDEEEVQYILFFNFFVAEVMQTAI